MTFFKSLAYATFALVLFVNNISPTHAQNVSDNNNELPRTIYHFPPPMDDPSFPFKTVTIDANTPQWAKMLYEVNPNIKEVRRLHWQWRKNNPDVKNGHTRNFKKLSGYLAEHDYVDESGYMEFPTGEELKAENQRILADRAEALRRQNESANRNSDNNTTWQLIGPTYKKTTSNNLVNRQINIYSISQSLSNMDILYCTSESGGTVFKTIDHGDTWFSVSDDLITNMGSRNIEVAPSDPDIVYLCAKHDIFKTTVGGNVWESVYYEYNSNNRAFIIHPTDPDIIFAGGDNGILKSIDGGANWTNPLPNVAIYDLRYQPGETQTIYALVNNTTTLQTDFYKSTDGGETWSVRAAGWPNEVSNGNKGGQMTTSDGNPEYIYAFVGANWVDSPEGVNIKILKSTNSGENWTTVVDYDNDFGINDGQGYYDWDIEMSDTDPDVLYGGTQGRWVTLNGFQTVNENTGDLGHADVQETLFNGDDLWVVNDGGIILFEDETFQNYAVKSKGINAISYWSFDQAWNQDVQVGTHYHNGTSANHENYEANMAINFGGAEPSFSLVAQPSGDKIVSKGYGAVNGYTMPDEQTGIFSRFSYNIEPNRAGYDGTNIEVHPNYYDTHFAALGNKVMKSENFGSTWEELAEFTYSDEYVEDIKMSRANTNVMWVGTTHSTGSHLYRSADEGASFVEVPQPNGFSANNFQISVSNADENVVYIGGDNKVSSPNIVVAKTLDGGATWINLWTPALIDYDFRRILHVDGTDGGVYVLTSRGVFYRNNTLPDWVLLAEGMAANTSYGYIKPFYRDKALRIATARGIYGAELYDTPQLSEVLIQPTVQKYSTNCARDTFFFDDFSVLEHAGATWSWSFPGAMYVSATDIRNPKVVYGQGGEFDVTLAVTKDGQTYSKTIEKMVKIGNDCSTVDDFAGTALYLNGDTEDRALIAPMDVTTNTFTFTAWVKPEGGLRAFSGIFTNGVWCAHCNDETMGLSINYHGNRLYYRWPGSTSGWAGSSSLELPSDEWSYVAMIMTPDKVTLMVNEEKWEDNRSHDPAYLGQLYFGDGNYSGFFNGAIDEATFWKRALTEQEVKELMHLTKDPSGDPDLLAYHQFNESSGDILDKAGIHSAILQNNAQRIISPIPVGAGFSNTQTANTGTIDFNHADFEANFMGTSVEVVASKINNEPFNLNGLLDGETPLANEYWAVHRYGTGDFTANLTFKTSADITSAAAANPCQFALYKRGNRSADNWEFVASATSADEMADKITFNVAVAEWSQYLVVKSTQAILRATSPLVLKNTVLNATSLESSYIFSATNLSNDVQITAPANFEISTTSGSSFGTNLTLSPTNGKIEATTIYVRFLPSEAKLYSDNIVHSSNGVNDLLVAVSASGIALDHFPGTALDLDGSSDYVNLGNPEQLQITGDLTLQMWLKPANFSTRRNPIGKAYGGEYTITQETNGTLTFYNGTSGSNSGGYEQTDSNQPLNLNEWNHITLVRDFTSNEVNWYINGELTNTRNTSYTPVTGGNSVYIGEGYVSGYEGLIDEVRIWNTALSLEEIREQMHLTLNGNEAGLVAYYQFNAASGDAIDNINGLNGNFVNQATRSLASEPVGGGFSNTQTEANDGSTSTMSFPNTGFEATVSNQNEAEIVASKIELAPNDNVGIGANESVADNQYWVVTRYGSGTFSANLSFTLVENLSSAEEAAPNTIQLYGRNKTSDGTWTLLAAASSVDATNNIANFDNIAAFEQYLVTRNPFPKITVSQPSLSFGNVDKNTYSTESTYTLSASKLTEDLIITAPNGFEISLTSNADFGTNLTLTPTAGTIEATTIYVRFSPTTSDYQSGEITHTSTGAMDRNIAIDGTAVVPEIEIRQAATILTNGETIDFSNHAVGANEVLFFTIKNTDLGSLNLTGEPKIIVSGTDASDFVVEESTTDATIATNNETTFRITFTPSSSGAKTAVINIANNDDDEGDYVLNLIGEGNAEPTINITSITDFENLLVGEISIEKTYTVSGSHLLEPVTITSTTGFEISLASGSGFTNTLTLHPVGGTIVNTTIYVRFVPNGVNVYQGTILHTSENAVTQTITTNGSSHQLAETVPGNAIQFNGTSDYVSIPHQPIFNFGEDTDFTVALWMKTDNWRNDASLASNKDWDDGRKNSWNIALGSDGQGIDVNVGDGSEDGNNRADLQSGNLNDGEWHHIAATFDRDGDVSLYVDGVLEESTSMAHVGNINSGLPVTFGRDSENEYFFEGLIDEAKIWTAALTAEQVREAMHITAEWNTPDLITYYQFNETTAFGSVFNLKDNLHGAMYGGSRVASTAAVGGGFVNTQTEMASNIIFTDTDVEMELSNASAEVVVSKINLAPNDIPAALLRVFDSQYWAIHRYGTGGFSGHITFKIAEDLTSEDEANPSDIALYGRAANTDGTWQMVATATAVDATNDKATFNDLTNLEQFIIAATSDGVAAIAASVQDETTCSGNAVTFTASATGGLGELSYQWQEIINGTPTDIANETDPSLTLATVIASNDGKQYQVRVSDNGGRTSDSNVATLTVIATPEIAIVENVTACNSYTLPDVNSIAGNNLNNPNYYTATGGNNSNLITNLELNTSQTVFIYDENGACFNEVAFDVSINDFTAGSAGQDQTIEEGDDVAPFSINEAAMGSNLSFQWQSRQENTSFSDIMGATEETYDESTLFETTYYRRITTSILNSVACISIGQELKIMVNEIVLPVEWLYARARAIHQQSLVEWATTTEINVKNYIVEWSIDGRHFEALTTIEAEHKGASYEFLHQQPIIGTNYYRIQQMDNNGMAFYTPIMPVDISDKVSSEIILYPNPATHTIFVKQIVEAEATNVHLYLFDVAGRLQKTVYLNGEVTSFEVSGLASGVYFYRVIGGDGIWNGTVVIE